MTWFRVDDHLSDHRKVRKAGTSAMGLWVLAGSWSAAHLTDGWVPREVALRYGTERQAERLTSSGLWAAGDVDGEPGWFFHQWIDHQPTREQVELRRKNAAERQAAWRANNNKGAGSDDESHRDTGVSNDVSNAAPDPTRPVPKDKKKTPSSSPAQKRGTRIPANFSASPAMVSWARDRVPQVDGRLETEKFINFWTAKSGAGATKVDWPATWRNWMLNAAERIGHQAGTNGYKSQTDQNIVDFLSRTGTDAQILQLPVGGES
jgi:hypothetical protein